MPYLTRSMLILRSRHRSPEDEFPISTFYAISLHFYWPRWLWNNTIVNVEREI